ncbi:MAG: GMC family oxidoreductase [Myxococcales bacterium]|nr:GMC family oxidoreductase [Myxococcales bacterium]
MSGRALAERWLRAHGAPDARQAAIVGMRRAARYPAPVGASWERVIGVLDRVAPLVALGRPGRASRLDDERFLRLDRAMSQHRVRELRLAWLLLRAPLIEALYADPAPHPPVHPLDDLQDVIRERASLRHDRFDAIVIGSGAGGAPVASVLARAGMDVAIVEAGGLLRADTAEGAVERTFLDQGMLGSLEGGGMTLVLAGSAIGGTTVINSGTSLRPLQRQLEDWDRQVGTRFGEGELEGYLDRVVDHLGIAPLPEERLDASARLVREGLRALGREGAFLLPRNAPGCQGAARCCFGCPNGAKLSTDRSYVPEAVAAGATLLANTVARGIREERDGVVVLVDGPSGLRRIRAPRLVLAAGAIGTPGLIRRNRLGERHAVAGDGLRIHPASKVFGWMPEPLPHGGVPQALGYHAEELPRVTFEGAHTPPAVTATVLQAAGERHRAWMVHHDHLANYGMMVRDRGTGSVREVGGRRIIRYALHDDDARDLGAALLLASEALFAAGAERVVLPLAGREAEVEGRAALAAIRPDDFQRKNLITSGFHPQGTAGIGRVVDADLRLLGSARISVADASVLPDSPGVNPQVTIMALALRLADRLVREG